MGMKKKAGVVRRKIARRPGSGAAGWAGSGVSARLAAQTQGGGAGHSLALGS